MGKNSAYNKFNKTIIKEVMLIKQKDDKILRCQWKWT